MPYSAPKKTEAHPLAISAAPLFLSVNRKRSLKGRNSDLHHSALSATAYLWIMPRCDVRTRNPEHYARVKKEQAQLEQQYFSQGLMIARICPYCGNKVPWSGNLSPPLSTPSSSASRSTTTTNPADIVMSRWTSTSPPSA